MIDFLRGTDVLIMDTQYDCEEYKQHIGWGHGCVDDVVSLAIEAEVKTAVPLPPRPQPRRRQSLPMLAHARELVASRKANSTSRPPAKGRPWSCQWRQASSPRLTGLSRRNQLAFSRRTSARESQGVNVYLASSVAQCPIDRCPGVARPCGMFELLKTDAHSKARLGRLTTTHGVVDTPVFMPVGTQGSVKAIDPRELREMGTQIILGNTYHLNIRPGLDIIRAAGGLHRFINWQRPSSPTAAGFRSSASRRFARSRPTASSSGRTWTARRCFSGRRRRWKSSARSARTSRWSSTNARRTPRRRANSAPPSSARSAGRASAANNRARRASWSSASCRAAATPRLREECAKALVAMEFDGYAIGGVSVGEPEPEMMKAVEMTEPYPAGEQGRATPWASARRRRWSS